MLPSEKLQTGPGAVTDRGTTLLLSLCDSVSDTEGKQRRMEDVAGATCALVLIGQI